MAIRFLKTILLATAMLMTGCTSGHTAISAPASVRLFVVAEQHAGKQVPDPHRFKAIIGYPNQCVAGIRCWTYQKGTRSPKSNFPESWYLHVNGVRVRDNVYHLYVMDPRSTGWQQYVANACSQHCFLDGMGSTSMSRAVPHIDWTAAQWTAYSALVVDAVVAAGKRALPNSVGQSTDSGAALIAAAGRGSTEAFNTKNAATILAMGRIWVSERGDCLAKYNAYLAYRARGDHFSCYELGHLPWDTSWLP